MDHDRRTFLKTTSLVGVAAADGRKPAATAAPAQTGGASQCARRSCRRA